MRSKSKSEDKFSIGVCSQMKMKMKLDIRVIPLVKKKVQPSKHHRYSWQPMFIIGATNMRRIHRFDLLRRGRRGRLLQCKDRNVLTPRYTQWNLISPATTFFNPISHTGGLKIVCSRKKSNRIITRPSTSTFTMIHTVKKTEET